MPKQRRIQSYMGRTKDGKLYYAKPHWREQKKSKKRKKRSNNTRLGK